MEGEKGKAPKAKTPRALKTGPPKEELIKIAMEDAKEYESVIGLPPTLREVYYRLVGKKIIAHTRSSYNRFSEVLAEARYEGAFPWSLIKDDTRKFPRYCEARTKFPDRPLTEDDLRKLLEAYVEEYSTASVNPWEDQPKRVIITVEKDSLLDTVEAVVRRAFPFGVYQIRSTRGYDSATDLHKLALDIALLPRHQRPVILHIGDYGPTGEDITRDLCERLKRISKRDDIIFEKVAVTLDQVIQYDLPCKPEKLGEVEKLRRDARYKKHVAKVKELAEKDPRVKALVEKWKTYEVVVEVEALTALRFDAFVDALKRAIEKHFDWDIYEKVTKPKIEELKKKAEEAKAASLEALKRLLGGSAD